MYRTKPLFSCNNGSER